MPAATTSEGPPAPVATQVIRQLPAQLTRTGGETSVVVHLTPPQLGRVLVRVVTSQDQQVRVHLRVESAVAGDALSAGLHQLSEAFHAHGLAPASVTIDLGLSNGFAGLATGTGSQSGDQLAQDNQGAPGPGGTHLEVGVLSTEAELAAEETLLNRNARNGRLLDYRV